MEEDIQNHSPTVMFRGTPCSTKNVQLSLVGKPSRMFAQIAKFFKGFKSKKEQLVFL